MKAVLLKAYGGVDQLSYEEVPDPKPTAGEVLVKVSATSLNPIDWKIRAGYLKDRMPLQLPAILGRDVAGVVVAVGPDVTRFTVMPNYSPPRLTILRSYPKAWIWTRRPSFHWSP
jgi:NADPH:quinone reductase-like Zn-dependent oxidoreductase